MKATTRDSRNAVYVSIASSQVFSTVSSAIYPLPHKAAPRLLKLSEDTLLEHLGFYTTGQQYHHLFWTVYHSCCCHMFICISYTFFSKTECHELLVLNQHFSNLAAECEIRYALFDLISYKILDPHAGSMEITWPLW